jgi:hypothetical protein
MLLSAVLTLNHKAVHTIRIVPVGKVRTSILVLKKAAARFS